MSEQGIGIGHHFAYDLAGKPTHWMPLPEPPKVEDVQAA